VKVIDFSAMVIARVWYVFGVFLTLIFGCVLGGAVNDLLTRHDSLFPRVREKWVVVAFKPDVPNGDTQIIPLLVPRTGTTQRSDGTFLMEAKVTNESTYFGRVPYLYAAGTSFKVVDQPSQPLGVQVIESRSHSDTFVITARYKASRHSVEPLQVRGSDPIALIPGMLAGMILGPWLFIRLSRRLRFLWPELNKS
jgi:hypothetical protein